MSNIKLLSTLLFALMIASPPAGAATVRQQFKASVAELQKNPGDKALREKIIKLALKLKPKPAVPEEAERRMARGRAAVKAAKDKEGFQDAAREYEKAALAAPWLAEAYYNLGIVSDKAGDYAGAMKSLKLYLLAAPGARNAKKVKTLVYEIEFRLEKATKENAVKAEAERKQKKNEAAISKLKSKVANFKYFYKKCFRKGWRRMAQNGVQLKGCNEKEQNGSNWSSWGTGAKGKFLFPDKKTVLLDGWCCSLWGTPHGSNISDIVWRRFKTEDGEKIPYGDPVWTEFNSSYSWLQCSRDRPIDSSRFDPKKRYDYCALKKE